MDAGWIVVAIFLAVLAVVLFAVARGMWRIWGGEPESEAEGSYGRQIFGRRRKS